MYFFTSENMFKAKQADVDKCKKFRMCMLDVLTGRHTTEYS